MLLYFRVKNYMSFKGDAVLDLRATSYVQHKNHTVKVNEETELLKSAAIYGANASGKSNLISAMYSLRRYILTLFLTDSGEETNADNHIKPIKIEPFLLGSESDSTEFEIFFIVSGRQMQYGFEIDIDRKIVSEWYYIDDKMVFENKKDNITFGTEYKKYLKNYKKVPEGKSYLPVLEYFLEREMKKLIIGDFIDFFKYEFNIFSELLFESTVKRLAGAVIINKKLIEDESYRNTVAKILNKIDVGIKGLTVQEQDMDSENNEKAKKITVKTLHNVYDENNNIIGEKIFDLYQESSGTLRFLAYIQNIIFLIEKGGVFIVDEMTSRLHPLLSKLIVDLFQSEKNTRAQLIFTTHDVSLLNKDQFRRDEVIFVDKDECGVSSIYALSDLKVREDSSFNKDYLLGKYGAIPIFDLDDLWGDE